MNFKNLISKLKSKIHFFNGKNKKVFTLSLVLVIILLGYFLFVSSDNKSDVKSESKQMDDVVSSNYSDQIERKIENMLLSLSGVSKAEVMIVCESSEVYEYLKNVDESKSENGNTTIKEEVVYEKNGSNTTPIIITMRFPKIIGVWVVINEVSPSTKLAITNSLKSVLNVDESRINILQER